MQFVVDSPSEDFGKHAKAKRCIDRGCIAPQHRSICSIARGIRPPVAFRPANLLPKASKILTCQSGASTRVKCDGSTSIKSLPLEGNDMLRVLLQHHTQRNRVIAGWLLLSNELQLQVANLLRMRHIESQQRHASCSGDSPFEYAG